MASLIKLPSLSLIGRFQVRMPAELLGPRPPTEILLPLPPLGGPPFPRGEPGSSSRSLKDDTADINAPTGSEAAELPNCRTEDPAVRARGTPRPPALHPRARSGVARTQPSNARRRLPPGRCLIFLASPGSLARDGVF